MSKTYDCGPGKTEDDLRRLLENWIRWAGHTNGSPTSRSLSDEVLARMEDRRNAVPVGVVIGQDAEFTEAALKAISGKERHALKLYYFKTTSLKRIGAELGVGANQAGIILHRAHSDFWEALANARQRAQAKRNRNVMTNDLSKVVPGAGAGRPKETPAPVIILFKKSN